MVDPNEVNLKELEDFESGGTQEMIKENGVQFFLLFFNTFFFFFFFFGPFESCMVSINKETFWFESVLVGH